MVILPKSVFFHIPKTGGSWVEKVLLKIPGSFKVEHAYKSRIGLLKDHVPPGNTKTEKFTFAFVRNPLDWYKSWWRSRMDFGWNNPRKVFTQLNRCKSDDFNEFVLKCLKKYPTGLATRIYKRFQHVDFIGQQENLKADLKKALDLAGEKYSEAIFRVKPFNVSKTRKPQYNFRVWQKIRKVEQYAFDFWRQTCYKRAKA